MAQTPTQGDYSLQRALPWSRYKTAATVTWGSSGNTCTITDAKVASNSFIEINVTGTTPQQGFWAISVTSGQIVITSSVPETSTLPLSYIIL